MKTSRLILVVVLLMLLVSCVGALAADKRVPTEDSVVYGEADGVALTMDYYAPKGAGPHPIAIIIHGGGWTTGTSKNGSEAYCADFLAPAGYAVFSINYRLAPKYPYPYMVHDVERAVRYLRHNAKRWDADPNRIALVGGSAGGYLSNMAGLLNSPGDAKAADPVDRESARVQAVVSLFAPSDLTALGMNDSIHALVRGLLEIEGERVALTEASPITYVNKNAPPFLLIQGDKDEYIPLPQSTDLQAALKKVGVRADIIVIRNGLHGTWTWPSLPGVPDWEKQMTEWMNEVLHHKGTIGEGIEKRVPKI
jgi:alpha-L-fucosidase 2